MLPSSFPELASRKRTRAVATASITWKPSRWDNRALGECTDSNTRTVRGSDTHERRSCYKFGCHHISRSWCINQHTEARGDQRRFRRRTLSSCVRHQACTWSLDDTPGVRCVGGHDCHHRGVQRLPATRTGESIDLWGCWDTHDRHIRRVMSEGLTRADVIRRIHRMMQSIYVKFKKYEYPWI